MDKKVRLGYCEECSESVPLRLDDESLEPIPDSCHGCDVELDGSTVGIVDPLGTRLSN